MADLGKAFEDAIRDKITTIPQKADVLAVARAKGRVLAVPGSMDYVQQVLPYCPAAEKQIVEPNATPPDLTTFDVLFVGCPGQLPLDKWREPINQFLASGGVLLTTDWCLDNLIVPMFPNTIRNGGSVEGSFELHVTNPKHPIVTGMEKFNGTPWEVEVASHQIAVLDNKKVQVLLSAPEMGEPSAVLVAFEVGAGLVVHAISHFHLQGTDERGEYVCAWLLTNVVEEGVARRHLKTGPVPGKPRVQILKSSPIPAAPPPPPSRIRIIKKPE
jgi:hypothetical protein